MELLPFRRIKVNTGVVIFTTEKRIGIGCVARDDTGKSLGFSSLSMNNIFSPLVVQSDSQKFVSLILSKDCNFAPKGAIIEEL